MFTSRPVFFLLSIHLPPWNNSATKPNSDTPVHDWTCGKNQIDGIQGKGRRRALPDRMHPLLFGCWQPPSGIRPSGLCHRLPPSAEDGQTAMTWSTEHLRAERVIIQSGPQEIRPKPVRLSGSTPRDCCRRRASAAGARRGAGEIASASHRRVDGGPKFAN